MEQGPALKLETGVLGTVDLGAGEIGRQKIRRKLNTMKAAFDTLTEHLDRACLGKSGSALNQQMSIREYGNQQTLDQTLLTNYARAHGGFQI